ncbi:hypothetical protein QW131_05220 [Roseibium salinum]|nr:hypothetical protein [Roseibium salinum]
MRNPSPHPPHASTKPNGQREKLPSGVLADDEAEPAAHAHAGGLSILGRLRGDKQGGAAQSAVSKEDIRRLQSTLFELLECKRTLDQAR